MADETTPAGTAATPASSTVAPAVTTAPKAADDKAVDAALSKDAGPAEPSLPLANTAPASDPPPFAEEHSDAIRNADDSSAAAASRAEADPDIDTDAIARMGYQVGQFDTSSGDSVLRALAFPPANAVAAEAAVEVRNAETANDNPSSPVNRVDGAPADHDAKAAVEKT